MKLSRGVIGFALLTLSYVGALAYIDGGNRVFEHGARLVRILPLVASFAFASFILRYIRWRWLLSRKKLIVPWTMGFLAYLAGFALTASPGKLGELLRIRYFAAMDVPEDQVIACFVFERMLDLIVVLFLSAGLGGFFAGKALAFLFVLMVIIAVIVLARLAPLWAALAQRMQKAEWDRLAKLALTLADGLAGAVGFFELRQFIVAMLLGVTGWTIQSLGCVYLVHHLGIPVPPLAAFSVYPLALLVGAASMLPGGIGTTEAAIILLLQGFGASFSSSALAAIGMRLSTLWFAILLGLVAIAILETSAIRGLQSSGNEEPALKVEHRSAERLSSTRAGRRTVKAKK